MRDDDGSRSSRVRRRCRSFRSGFPAAGTLLLLTMAGCAPPASRGGDPVPGPTPSPPAEGRRPAGEVRDSSGGRLSGGSLPQEAITLAIVTPELSIQVTPLEEELFPLLAPDVRSRLRALRDHHAAAFDAAGAPWSGSTLFLVSLFARSPDRDFDPEALQLSISGLSERPLSIRGLTSEWGRTLLPLRTTVAAVYAFPGRIDLDGPWSVRYGPERSEDWNRRIPALNAERARLLRGSGG